MALTKASDILGLEKKVKAIAVPIDSLSASKVTVDLSDYSATNAAGAFEEIKEDFEDISTYSTNEKIVGKWIDGSNVYEKTLTAELTGAETVITHGIENIQNYLSISGFTNQNLILPFVTELEAWSIYFVSYSSTSLTIKRGTNLTQNTAVTITLRYTKTAPVTTKKTTKKRG